MVAVYPLTFIAMDSDCSCRQFVGLLYVLVLCFKQEMEYIILGRAFFISNVASNILAILWIVTWCNQHLISSSIAVICTALSLCHSTVAAHCYVMIKSNANSVHFGYDGDVPLWFNEHIRTALIVLVVNGTSAYALWMMIASVLSVGILFCYKADISNEPASFVVLTVLTVILIVYWCLDIVHRNIRIVTRWTLAPYVVILVALCGIITNHGLHSDAFPTSLMAVMLLAISCTAFGFKLHYSLCGWNTDSSSWDGQLLGVGY